MLLIVASENRWVHVRPLCLPLGSHLLLISSQMTPPLRLIFFLVNSPHFVFFKSYSIMHDSLLLYLHSDQLPLSACEVTDEADPMLRVSCIALWVFLCSAGISYLSWICLPVHPNHRKNRRLAMFSDSAYIGSPYHKIGSSSAHPCSTCTHRGSEEDRGLVDEVVHMSDWTPPSLAEGDAPHPRSHSGDPACCYCSWGSSVRPSWELDALCFSDWLIKANVIVLYIYLGCHYRSSIQWMSTSSSWHLAISGVFDCLTFGKTILQVHLNYLRPTFFAIYEQLPLSFFQTCPDGSTWWLDSATWDSGRIS